MKIKTDFGDISASRDTLNELCMMLGSAENYYISKGRTALAERASIVEDQIFSKLKQSGYYDK